MKNKTLRTIMFLSFVFIALTFVGCTIDLSHKHYTDKYGYCSNCDTDTSITLEKNESSEFVSDEMSVGYFGYTDEMYYKFTLDKDSKIKISLSCDSSSFGEIKLYTKENDYIYLSSDFDAPEENAKVSNEILEKDTYYIFVKFYEETTCKVVVSLVEWVFSIGLVNI